MEEVTPKKVLNKDGYNGESVAKDQHHVCDSKKMFQDNAELSEYCSAELRVRMF
jgi:hypothetical protein